MTFVGLQLGGLLLYASLRRRSPRERRTRCALGRDPLTDAEIDHTTGPAESGSMPVHHGPGLDSIGQPLERAVAQPTNMAAGMSVLQREP
jgi:hypothetical protein